MKWVEIGFIILSIVIMFFWAPSYRTYLTTMFLKIPPINSYARFFGLGASWPMFSNPGPGFKEIKAQITFADGKIHTGFCFEDPLLIDVIGIKQKVHRAKYYSSITNGQIPSTMLAKCIYDGFKAKNQRLREIKLDMILIQTDKYPNYIEKKLKNLITVDLSGKKPKFSRDADPVKPIAKAG